MARPSSAMLQFSIDELRVLDEAWKLYWEGRDAPAVSEKLEAPKAPKFFTRDEALLLAAAFGRFLEHKPRNIEGGMMLDQSEISIIGKLLMLAVTDSDITT